MASKNIVLKSVVTLLACNKAVLCYDTISNVKHTFFGYLNNSPPGAAVAYNCGGRNYVAGGTGTYSDPLTFASAPGEFNKASKNVVRGSCLVS